MIFLYSGRCDSVERRWRPRRYWVATGKFRARSGWDHARWRGFFVAGWQAAGEGGRRWADALSL